MGDASDVECGAHVDEEASVGGRRACACRRGAAAARQARSTGAAQRSVTGQCGQTQRVEDWRVSSSRRRIECVCRLVNFNLPSNQPVLFFLFIIISILTYILLIVIALLGQHHFSKRIKLCQSLA